MSLSPFDGPIPGQSLTAEPGNTPWEKPSKFPDPLDAFEMYMERLGSEEVIDDVMDMLDVGIPIDTVAGAMLSMGVMEGLHTVDVKLILRPLVAAHIKALADVVGVDYKMSMAEYEDKDAKEKQKRRAKLQAKLAIKTGKFASEDTMDEGEQLMLETQEQLEAPQEEPPMEKAPVGLMAKEQ